MRNNYKLYHISNDLNDGMNTTALSFLIHLKQGYKIISSVGTRFGVMYVLEKKGVKRDKKSTR